MLGPLLLCPSAPTPACLQYVEEDELVEVTPVSVRVRKNPTVKKRK